MTDLPKTFDPAAIEAHWYAHWESHGLFRPERPDAQPFTIVNPPPNVTGSLHIGHALDNTLQDIVIRYERLRGKDALWVVGTDHAGIATQMVVERQMNARGEKRTDFTRDGFIEKVWQWKEESGGEITGQLRRLGCSMDWSREQFTMDPHFSRAVTKLFVDLYDKGLLYRDKRLVNWDPHFRSAISDLEVETREIHGKFWHFRYPLADGVTLAANGDLGARDYIVVATTRPETMLADMAVAVNAADPRYASVIGKHVKLPITGRLIPIIADDHADPELGSGAVKITPGHDFNDFEVGKRAGFRAGEMLNMLDADAKVAQVADNRIPSDFIGLDRFDARGKVVAAMDALGLLEQVEDRVIQTPYGDRSGVVIEPWLTDQWYVDAATLAKPAIEAVRSGAIEIVPKTWEKTYFNWMENIQPWCVSRQLWWGHRIPVWYGPERTADGGIGIHTKEVGWTISLEDESIFVAENEEQAKQKAREFYSAYAPDGDIRVYGTMDEAICAQLNAMDEARDEIALFRDEDVLDTWFSSALWPFATLGWPEENLPSPSGEGQGVGAVDLAQHSGTAPTPTPPLKGRGLVERHYPNDLLISGFDILFFWDARMAMMGLECMSRGGALPLENSVPWKRLYLHGLVRAADGSKMSKSKGNTIDPLGLIDAYGADALRFFMSAMESQGRDIKMDEKRVEGYRNFATKLWNAARFLQSNGIGASTTLAAPKADLPVNKWIIGQVVETVQAIDKALADLRFDAAANAIYHFVWDQFCDWYLELIKPVLSPSPLSERDAPEASDVDGAPSSAVRAELVEAPSLPSGGNSESDGSAALRQAQGERSEETRVVAAWAFDQILVMLHPFMPFITEELWHAMGDRANDLIVAQWPAFSEPVNSITRVIEGQAVDAQAELSWIIGTIVAVRAAKNEAGIAPGQRLTAYLEDVASPLWSILPEAHSMLERVGRISIRSDGATPAGSVLRIAVPGATLVIALEGVIDITAEKARLTKAMDAVVKERDALAGRLSNASFVERAKPEAVEKARADHAEKSSEAERLAAALARLG